MHYALVTFSWWHLDWFVFPDDTAALIHSLRKAQVEEEATSERSSASPIEAHNGKNRPLPERRAEKKQSRVAASVYASPSNSNTTESFLCHESAKSSPDADRYKQIVESPSWRRGENFVRQSRDRSEDPFVTSTPTVLAPGRSKWYHIWDAKRQIWLSQFLRLPSALVMIESASSYLRITLKPFSLRTPAFS